MKKYVLVVLLFSVLLGCRDSTRQSTANSNNASGITFITPDGWNITDEEALEDGTYFISVEKDGLDASGLVSIITFDELLDVDDTIRFNLSQLKENTLYKDATFGSIVDATFAEKEARSCSYSFQVLGIPHSGTMFAFHGRSQTVFVLEQEAIEDKDKNKTGFDIIEKSLVVK